MDQLVAMRLFARIVERRSFTLAAQDIGIPRSTATQVLKRLEDRPQRATLAKEPHARSRRLSTGKPITAAAWRSLPTSRPPKMCLRALNRATTARGRFTARWRGTFLFPRLPDFLRRYPDIQLRISEETAWSISCAKVWTACCA